MPEFNSGGASTVPTYQVGVPGSQYLQPGSPFINSSGSNSGGFKNFEQAGLTGADWAFDQLNATPAFDPRNHLNGVAENLANPSNPFLTGLHNFAGLPAQIQGGTGGFKGAPGGGGLGAGGGIGVQENPYLQQLFDRGADQITDRVNSQFGMSGNVGGTQHAQIFSDSLGDFGAQLYGGAFDANQNRQLQALGQGAQLTQGQTNAGASFLPEILNAQQTGGFGGLQSYSDILAKLQGSQPQSEQGSDSFDKLLGLGTTAASLYFSSKDFKEDKAPVNTLDKLMSIPIEQWKYKDGIADGAEHIGTYAEDFKEAFNVGDGKTINVGDAIGVLMRSVQELTAEVRQLRGNSHA